MRTPRLPVVDWTDAPVDLNGLVRFAQRRDLVSACVPSHFNWPLTSEGRRLNKEELYDLYYSPNVNRWISGPGSIVGMATVYELDGQGIESRRRARFSTPVHTGPKAHAFSCTMGTGSFPGVSCGRGVTLTPHPLLVPRSKTE